MYAHLLAFQAVNAMGPAGFEPATTRCLIPVEHFPLLYITRNYEPSALTPELRALHANTLPLAPYEYAGNHRSLTSSPPCSDQRNS